MALTIIAKYGNGLEVVETLTYGLSSNINDQTLIPSLSYVNGNSAISLGINQAFIKGAVSVTLTSSASVTYTLTSLTDDLNRSISFAGGVRFWMITVTSRTAGDYLTVGAAATNPWTSPFSGTTPAVKVFDLLILGVGSTDSYAVTASSNEQLKIVNSGSNSITFKLALLGCLT